ncbi:MAG: hypothetical protein HOP23_03030 [Methylococcaceae bacterium]|nr:hypothetical protein [Methylococcaceae bacterium]
MISTQAPFALDCMDAGGRAPTVGALGDAWSSCREPVEGHAGGSTGSPRTEKCE